MGLCHILPTPVIWLLANFSCFHTLRNTSLEERSILAQPSELPFSNNCHIISKTHFSGTFPQRVERLCAAADGLCFEQLDQSIYFTNRHNVKKSTLFIHPCGPIPSFYAHSGTQVCIFRQNQFSCSEYTVLR